VAPQPPEEFLELLRRTLEGNYLPLGMEPRVPQRMKAHAATDLDVEGARGI
jgi:hypothetical protein